MCLTRPNSSSSSRPRWAGPAGSSGISHDAGPHHHARRPGRPADRVSGRDGGVPLVGDGLGVLGLVADGPVARPGIHPRLALAETAPPPTVRRPAAPALDRPRPPRLEDG